MEAPFHEDPAERQPLEYVEESELDMMEDDEVDVNAIAFDNPVAPDAIEEVTEEHIEEVTEEHIEEEVPELPVELIVVSPKDIVNISPVEERRTESVINDGRLSSRGSPTQTGPSNMEKLQSLAESTSNPTRERVSDSESETRTPRRDAVLQFKNIGNRQEIDNESPPVALQVPDKPVPKLAKSTIYRQTEPQPAPSRVSVNFAMKRSSIQQEMPFVATSSPPSKPRAMMCKKHKEKPLEVVCMTDKVLICSTCALFDGHQGHQFREMAEVQSEIGERAEK